MSGKAVAAFPPCLRAQTVSLCGIVWMLKRVDQFFEGGAAARGHIPRRVPASLSGSRLNFIERRL